MVVSVSELKNYTETVAADDSIIDKMIRAAQEISENYLGYDIEAQDYDVLCNGSGERTLSLGVRPLISISSVLIDGESKDPEEFKLIGELLYYTNDIFPEGELNTLVSFRAGYEAEDIPAIIWLTIVRIASVLLSEGSGHIGVTSISDGNTGSRTFMERSFKRYLKELDPYRVFK